ncbi:hypothetical protein [Allochromatium tepidum]|uniref:Amino acid ABC transporter substrate-binding protein n=1 Tax=Allochromatium tepidum TaxID=553982 RepID=A0ABN6GFJ4_9GAMM|nr:hypothetical protein [Allochromatium tepidum]BCU06661.1 hypothetical protein Atep_13380 [Allochromatium tepidum]
MHATHTPRFVGLTRSLLGFVLTVLVLLPAAWADARVLRVIGDENYPPYLSGPV